MNLTGISWLGKLRRDRRLRAWLAVPRTGYTWNPLLGCKEVSPGCKHCWARDLVATRMAKNPSLPEVYRRLTVVTEGGKPQWTGHHKLMVGRVDEPLRVRKGGFVFVCDMGDLFYEGHSFEEIAAVFGVMIASTWHSFFVLTKRPDRMLAFFAWLDERAKGPGGVPHAVQCGLSAASFGAEKVDPLGLPGIWPARNIYLGVSVDDREHGLPRLPELRKAPAVAYFASIEPLLEDLGEVDWRGIDQVIVGGESGKDARGFRLAWAERIFAQAERDGAARWFKQGGSNILDVLGWSDPAGADPEEWPAKLRVQERPRVMRLAPRVVQKVAKRMRRAA